MADFGGDPTYALVVISCQFALGTGWDQRICLVNLILLPKVGIVHVVEPSLLP